MCTYTYQNCERAAALVGSRMVLYMFQVVAQIRSVDDKEQLG
jgi:hypothetical protein